MKMTKKITMMLLAVCLLAAGAFGWAQSVQAAGLNSVSQAQNKALQKVPGATVIETDQDYDNGVLVYEISLVKGNKKYDLKYRASNAKLIKYEWEKVGVGASANKPVMSESACRQLAQKKVKNGTIISINQKIDDGISIYKVKMTAGSKTYTLKYHARTGALIDYEWELTTTPSGSSNTGNGYIGLSKAKNIALNSVPGGTVVKAEFDMDDGVPVYEIEIIKGNYEYEFKIHAKTGSIIEREKDWND